VNAEFEEETKGADTNPFQECFPEDLPSPNHEFDGALGGYRVLV
jgi:hypothetical protein